MTNTILILWWYWYIGSHIAVELLNEWYRVIILDNLSNSKESVWQWINTITWKSHIFVRWSILDTSFLNSVMQQHDIDIVVHCAALKAVWESCENPYDYYETNAMWTANVLESMNTYWIRKILFSSSTTVYDTSRCEAPFEECYPIWWTSSPYGTTKVINELMMKDYTLHKWLEVLSLRYFNPIGAHQSWIIGEDPAQPPTTLLPIILQTLTWHRTSMVVYGNDYNTHDGTCLRDYIHVSDVAQAHVSGIQRLLLNQKPIFEPVNIGTWRPLSVLELIKTVEEVTSLNVPRSNTNRRAGDIPIAYANTLHAKDLLGWEAKFTIPEAVEDAWRYWSSHFASH